MRGLRRGLTAALACVLTASIAQVPSGEDTVDPSVYGSIQRSMETTREADGEEVFGSSSYGVGGPEGTTGGDYELQQTLSFSCSKKDDTHNARSGTGYRSSGFCSNSGISLSRCTALNDVGRSCRPEDWSAPVTIASGASRSLGDGADASAVCADGVCQVTVQEKGGIRTSAGELEAAGTEQMAESEAEGGYLATTAQTATSEDYLAYRRSTGVSAAQCQNRVSGSAEADGRIVNCEGEDLGQLDFEAYECAERCVDRQEETLTTTESCEASVPSRKYTCTTSFASQHCYAEPTAQEHACQQSLQYQTKVCQLSWGAAVDQYLECPTGTYFNPANGRCGTSGLTCPDGYSFNPETNNCQQQVASCAPPMTYDASANICRGTRATCPTGFNYNAGEGVCEKTEYACPPDYSFNDEKKICERAVPVCPEGASYNESAGVCETTTYTCPSGYAFDEASNTCSREVPTCPEGYAYSPPRNTCEKTTYTCQAGYTLNPVTHTCSRTVQTCPDGFTLNAGNNTCEKTGYSCPDGYDLNETNNSCERAVPTCPDTYAFNPGNGRCEKSTYSCQDGFTLNADTQSCSRTTTTCPTGFDYNAGSNSCEQTTYSCPDGFNLDPDSHTCEHTEITCPAGFAYSVTREQCERTSLSCDPGYTLNPGNNRCEREVPTCPTGYSYDASSNQCSKASYSCPAGYDFNEADNTCEHSVLACPDGYTYDAAANLCRKTEYACPAGYTLDPASHQCSLTTPTCPAGYTLNNGVCEQPYRGCADGDSYNAALDRCEEPRQCPSGYRLAGDGNTCLRDVPACQAPGDTWDGGAGAVSAVSITVPNGQDGQASYSQGSASSAVSLDLHYEGQGYACPFLGNPHETSASITIADISKLVGASIETVDRRNNLSLSINGTRAYYSGNSCQDTDAPLTHDAPSTDILALLRAGQNQLEMITYNGSPGFLFLNASGHPEFGVNLHFAFTCNETSACASGTTAAGIACARPADDLLRSEAPGADIQTEPASETELTAERSLTVDSQPADATYDTQPAGTRTQSEPPNETVETRQPTRDTNTQPATATTTTQAPVNDTITVAADQSIDSVEAGSQIQSEAATPTTLSEEPTPETQTEPGTATVGTTPPGSEVQTEPATETVETTPPGTTTITEPADETVVTADPGSQAYTEAPNIVTEYQAPTDDGEGPNLHGCSFVDSANQDGITRYHYSCTQDADGRPVSSCSDASLAGWERENVFGREYRGSKLVAWKQGYSRTTGWTPGCVAAAQASQCFESGSTCTDSEPRVLPSGLVVDHPCFEREQIVSCLTASSTSSCAADGNAGMCQNSSETCESFLTMETRECHYERDKIDHAYLCRADLQLDIDQGVCWTDPVCPDNYKLHRPSGQCRFEPFQGCDKAKGTPGEGSVIVTREPPLDSRSGGRYYWVDPYTIQFSHGTGRTWCGDPKVLEWEFDLVGGIDTFKQFELRATYFDDGGAVYVNGTEIVNHGLGRCSNAVKGQGWYIDILPYLRDQDNVITLKATSRSGGLTAIASFTVARKCAFGSSCGEGLTFNDFGQCVTPVEVVSDDPELDITTCVPSGERCADTGCGTTRYEYDCGYRPNPISACDAGALSVWKFEARYNERSDAGQVVSWDETYSRYEQTITPECVATTHPAACEKVSETCIEPNEKTINGASIKRDCFHTETTYNCLAGRAPSACKDREIEADCQYSHSVCQNTDPDTGRCLREQDVYVCQTTGASESCEAGRPEPALCLEPRHECMETTSAGICTKETTIYECYEGAPDRCMNDESCTFDSAECALRDASGLCSRQTQNYSCERTRVSCTSRESVCAEEPPGEMFGEQFNNAMAAYAKVDALVSEANLDPSDLRIFGGKPMECTESTGGDVLGANCCGNNADDESTIGDECDEEEKELAPGKRAGRAHFVGDYCKTDLPLIGCVQDAETYCLFDSMFARLIQEQGREQLAVMAAAPPASETQQTLTAAFMGAAGGWQPAIQVQNRPLRLFTWGAACADGETMFADQSIPCPVGDEFFAAYCVGDDCPLDEMPVPYRRPQSHDWKLARLEAGGSHSVYLDTTVDAGGSCVVDNDAAGGYGVCSLIVTSWPHGVSSNAQLAVDVSWTLFAPPGAAPGYNIPVRRSGRFRFKPYQIARTNGTQMPASIPMQVQLDNGVWRIYNIPTTVPVGGMVLTASPETRIFGKCEPLHNWCTMKVTTRVEIAAKPWCPGGDCPRKDSLDCTGFTINEFMALDFDEMDLSEYTATIAPTLPAEDLVLGITAAGAQESVQNYESGAEQTSGNSASDHVLRVKPIDGRPPWDTVASLGHSMKVGQGVVKVEMVTIHWGDGSSEIVDPAAGLPMQIGHSYTQDVTRDYTVTAIFELENGETRRAQSTVHSWTEDAPLNTAPYGGGQSGGGEYTTDDSASGYKGRYAPPSHVPAEDR